MERRTFLCWLLSGASALPLRGVRLHAQAATLTADGVTTLRAMAPVLLPSQLRAPGHDKVVNDFVQWLSAYRSGAERSWGYGNPRKSGTPTIDAARYASQLREIDQRARARGAPLPTLPPDAQRSLLTELIEQSGVRELPSSPDGRHVITDFMAFFYTGGPAHDMAYGAKIGRGICRGLKGSTARPSPLTAGD
jgi:hypothetical protein